MGENKQSASLCSEQPAWEWLYSHLPALEATWASQGLARKQSKSRIVAVLHNFQYDSKKGLVWIEQIIAFNFYICCKASF